MNQTQHEITIKRYGPRWSTVQETTTLFGIEIEAGFETDGGTIPSIFWPIVGSPYGDICYACVTHDKMLSSDGQSFEARKIADSYFFHNLRKSGIGLFRSILLYRAVRAWSWFYVRKFKRG